LDIEKIFKNNVPAAVYLKNNVEHADQILVIKASSQDDAIILSKFIEKYLFENQHYTFSEYTSENSQRNDQIKKYIGMIRAMCCTTRRRVCLKL
jgi:GTPase Era involved in 16S rRNA processing